MKISSSAVC